LQIRTLTGFVPRHEKEWPIARTRWTKFYLDLVNQKLAGEPPADPAVATYDAAGDGVTFFSEPLRTETEITGPLAAKLFVSSTTTDADLFVIFRVFSPENQEVVFQGALDPHTPIGQGWLRASHRKLDPDLSRPYRPYHRHDEKQPLTPGQIYELDIEIWPTCIVVPEGYRLAFTVRGRDYEYPGEGARLKTFVNAMKGCGPFIHEDPRDRPADIFGGMTTLHADARRVSYVLLPVVPPQDATPVDGRKAEGL